MSDSLDCAQPNDDDAYQIINELLKTKEISLYDTDLTYKMIKELCGIKHKTKLQILCMKYHIKKADRIRLTTPQGEGEGKTRHNDYIENIIRQLENIEKIEFDHERLLPCKIEKGDPTVFNENVLDKFIELKENIPDSGIIDTLNGMLFKESSQGGKRKSKSVKKSHKPKSKKSKKKPSRRKRRTNRRQK